MIKKLQYIIHSRSDIALSIWIVERFFANPRENHLMAIKRIMRYLKGTEDMVYTTRKMRNLNWKPTLMLIVLKILMTEIALVEEHFS